MKWFLVWALVVLLCGCVSDSVGVSIHNDTDWVVQCHVEDPEGNVIEFELDPDAWHFYSGSIGEYVLMAAADVAPYTAVWGPTHIFVMSNRVWNLREN